MCSKCCVDQVAECDDDYGCCTSDAEGTEWLVRLVTSVLLNMIAEAQKGVYCVAVSFGPLACPIQEHKALTYRFNQDLRSESRRIVLLPVDT